MSDARTSDDTKSAVIELDRLAVAETVRLLATAGADDWQRPTPCAAWDLRSLVAHMTVQHLGFAASAEGAGPELDGWEPVPVDDPYASYEASAEKVTSVFARPGIAAGEFWLPELTTSRPFPAVQAIGFHFLDYVVHAWDVARTLGAPLELSDEVVDQAMVIGEAVPDNESRRRPGAAFGPAREASQNADAWDRLVAHLGRSPSWQPAYS